MAGAPPGLNNRRNKMSNELVPYSDIEKMGKAVAESSLFGIKTQQQAIALMLVAQAICNNSRDVGGSKKIKL